MFAAASDLGDVCGRGRAQRLGCNGLSRHQDAGLSVSVPVQLERKKRQEDQRLDLITGVSTESPLGGGGFTLACTGTRKEAYSLQKKAENATIQTHRRAQNVDDGPL